MEVFEMIFTLTVSSGRYFLINYIGPPLKWKGLSYPMNLWDVMNN